MTYSVHFSFSKLFSVSRHIQILYCLCLILHVFQFPRHIPGPLVCVLDFSCFSVFLIIFHVLRCVFFIFHDFQFSHRTPGPTVCNSHFSSFSFFFFALFQVLRYAFLIFHIFQCFSRNFMSYSVCFSFSMTSVFLPCFRSYSENLLFSTFSSVSRHIPCQTVFVSYFLTFFSFLIKIQALHYIFVNFHVFDCFLTYSRSYNVCVSFKTFLVFCS